MADAARLRIDIWSDYVCPFCYLELPVIDHLQQPYGTTLEVRWRAFELRPEPVPPFLLSCCSCPPFPAFGLAGSGSPSVRPPSRPYFFPPASGPPWWSYGR